MTNETDSAEATLRALLGIGPEGERLDANLASYRRILSEIEKLRALDLTEVHPAVVFDPLLPYRDRAA